MNNHDGIPHFEVPAELRAVTEKSIEQARVAFNTFMSAAQQAVTFPDRASSWASARYRS
jgi:hypothetical protein